MDAEDLVGRGWMDGFLADSLGIDQGMRSLLDGYVAGGKRLRARLALLPSTTVGGDSDAALRYGTFVELIHAGTLCHDDIVDRCAIRRGRPSIVAGAGSRVASLVGMLLMWGAYDLIASEPAAVRQAVADAAGRVARGQLEEMEDLWVEVSTERYIARQRAKTGALFQLAGSLGAHAARLDATTAEAVVAFAAEVGLAFQVADDIADVVGTAGGGRIPGTDLREGVLTLPALFCLSSQRGGEFRELLAEVEHHRDPDVVGQCCALLVSEGWVSRAAGELREMWARASNTLTGVRPTALREALETYAVGVQDALR